MSSWPYCSRFISVAWECPLQIKAYCYSACCSDFPILPTTHTFYFFFLSKSFIRFTTKTLESNSFRCCPTSSKQVPFELWPSLRKWAFYFDFSANNNPISDLLFLVTSSLRQHSRRLADGWEWEMQPIITNTSCVWCWYPENLSFCLHLCLGPITFSWFLWEVLCWITIYSVPKKGLIFFRQERVDWQIEGEDVKTDS